IRCQNEYSLVLDESCIGLRIVQNPSERDVAKIRSLECHCELRLIAERMAVRVELCPAVHVHGLDDQGVAVPSANGIAEPRRRIAVAMWTTVGRNDSEHCALFEEKRDVFIVLD